MHHDSQSLFPLPICSAPLDAQSCETGVRGECGRAFPSIGGGGNGALTHASTSTPTVTPRRVQLSQLTTLVVAIVVMVGVGEILAMVVMSVVEGKVAVAHSSA